MMKKLTALALALLLGSFCLFATACQKKDEEVPEGMKSVTVSGEPFILYVPEAWTDNSTSGISGAYFPSPSKILVSARYFTPAAEGMTIDAYLDACVASYTASLQNFALTERIPALLGGENAQKISYTMTEDNVNYTCFQIVTIHSGDVISLYGYCPSDLYELRRADYDQIVTEFVLCEKNVAGGTEVVDKKTPEGMKIASADHLEYRFYVPKSWICDPESGRSEAYYPESGKSNVSLSSYVPDASISIGDYFSQCEAEYATTLPHYERLSETETTVDERVAYSYTYRCVVDGWEFRIRQTVFTYNGIIYSLTYTALADNFDAHLADVDAMLAAFRFR